MSEGQHFKTDWQHALYSAEAGFNAAFPPGCAVNINRIKKEEA